MYLATLVVSGDIKLMTRILKAAIQHRGFAFVDMLQPSPLVSLPACHFAQHNTGTDRHAVPRAAMRVPSRMNINCVNRSRTDDVEGPPPSLPLNIEPVRRPADNQD